MDSLYEEFSKDPLEHIRQAKQRGITSLIGIKGIIDNNPNMSNGSGKSSIFEGICYARYDRIIRKTVNTDKTEKAGTSVVRRINGDYPKDLKESYVEEYLENNGGIYRIKRGRTFSKGHKSHTPVLEFEYIGSNGVSSLSSHRTKDTKLAIEEVITTNYDLFANSQMFGQNDAGKILIGTDKIRKEMLISLLHVEDIVQGCLERIRKSKNDQQKKVDSVRANISLIERGIIDALKPYLSSEESIKAEFGFSSEYPKILQDGIKCKKQETEKNVIDTKEKITNLDNKIGILSKSEKIVEVEKIKEEGKTIKRDRDAKEQAKNEQMSEWKKIKQENEQTVIQRKKDKISKISKLETLKNNLEEKKKSIDQFNINDLKSKLKKCEEAKALKPKLTDELKVAKVKVSDNTAALADIKANIRQKTSDISKLELQLKQIKEDNFVCTECKSVVNRQHIFSKIKEYQDGLMLQELKLKDIETSFEKDNTLVLELENKIQRIFQYSIKENEIHTQIKNHEEDIKRIQDLQTSYSELIENINSIDKEIENLEVKTQEYEIKCKSIEQNFSGVIEILNKELTVISQKYKDAQKNAEAVLEEINKLKEEKLSFENSWAALSRKVGELTKEAEYQVKQEQELKDKNNELENSTKNLNRLLLLEDIYGLDGVQTRIIKKYLPLLNLYIKEFLDILTQGKMKIKFEINDRSKVDLNISGSAADSFDLLSGGEKMVARLAVDIALALLSFSRSSQKPEMICLDELFECLDKNHTDGVMKVLEKLNNKFDRIIVISHREELYDYIQNYIVVEKDNNINGCSRISCKTEKEE